MLLGVFLEQIDHHARHELSGLTREGITSPNKRALSGPHDSSRDQRDSANECNA